MSMYATAQPRAPRSFFGGRPRMPMACAATLAAFMFPAASALAQQPPAPPQAAQEPLQRDTAKPLPAAPAQQTAASTPAHPDWPANDKPGAAGVVWDSHGLRIDASNSSLEQILKDVSTDTGAKVEGLHTDERIFGTYGPGTARDVLSQLLDGSDYDVLMIGDQGQGTPRQIVLSERSSGPAPANNAGTASNNGRPTSNNEEDLEAEQEIREQEQQQQQLQQQMLEQQNMRNNPPQNAPQPPGQPPRTPQQIMQQMQDQQQQQQMQNQPR